MESRSEEGKLGELRKARGVEVGKVRKVQAGEMSGGEVCVGSMGMDRREVRMSSEGESWKRKVWVRK